MTIHEENILFNKLLVPITIALTGFVGTGLYVAYQNEAEYLAGKEEPILESKHVLEAKIDADIAIEQATAISKGEMTSKEVIGTDGVKRTVIPYVSPDGRKGYTVVYEKTEILTDKNGSTTEKVYRQQIDYGHENRTELW